MICASKWEKANTGPRKAQKLALNNYDVIDKVPQKEERLLPTDFEDNRGKQGNFLLRTKIQFTYLFPRSMTSQELLQPEIFRASKLQLLFSFF